MINKKNLTRKFDYTVLLSLVNIFLYLFFYFAKIKSLLFIPGLFLFMFLPGKIIIELIPYLSLRSGIIGNFSLSIAYSIILSTASGIYAQKIFSLNSDFQTWFVIILNATLLVIYFLKKIFFQKNKLDRIYSLRTTDIIPIGIVAFVLLLFFLNNHLTQNLDNYFGLLSQSIEDGIVYSNPSQLIKNSRVLFIPFLRFSSKFLALDARIVFRFLLPTTFFLLSLSLYDFLKINIKSRLAQTGLYLSFLAPPVVFVEINTIMPQVIAMVFTIPIIIASTLALKKRQVGYSFIAVLLSLFAFLFHELGAILLLVSSIAFLVNIYDYLFIKKAIPAKYAIIIAVLLASHAKSLASYGQQIKYILEYTVKYVADFHCQWWFIDDYIDVGGTRLMWTGINAFYYYLNNGILLIILFIVLVVVFTKKRFKPKIYYLPSFLYFFIYFSIAEILPRIGIIFLPSRAWPHMMLGLVCLIAISIADLQKDKGFVKKFSITLIIFSLIGASGSLYVTSRNVKKVYREELPAANYIKKNTPADAIILSTQDNYALTKFYAERPNYYKISGLKDKLSEDKFKDLIKKAIEDCQKDKIVVYRKGIYQKLITTSGGKVIQEQESILQPEIIKNFLIDYNGNNKIFFIYSYRKLKRLNNANIETQSMIDNLNRDSYGSFGFNKFFIDDNVLVIDVTNILQN